MATTVSTDPILFEVDAATGVATLTLNRPERYNAFNLQMITQWREALTRVEREPEIRAVVVTGAGKAFCAGGDMDELESFMTMTSHERKCFLWENVHQIAFLLERIDCPVIAAINGTARGAGLDMALMCDLRVMDASVVVAETYVDVGLMPGDGGAWYLPRLVGTAKALELLWTGDPIDAQMALTLGLVNKVAPAGKALEEALALATRIAAKATHAVRFAKRSVYQNMSGAASLRSHLDAVSSHMSILEDMPAFRDKVEAFRQRAKKK
ncbi:MAG: enoyl-CoA hydratase-related protein [Burkholderiaceae bacterium]|nr:enoyl-CoA hydratase-related protein [Burkholderiaceae bacterium]